MNDKPRIAVYPGTFDPTTNGHMSLIERAGSLCDKLIIGVARGAGKEPWFSIDQRVTMIKGAVEKRKLSQEIEITAFDGLLADFARKSGATAIIRGLRAVSDFEYEFQMALMNRKLARSLETVFLMPSLAWVYLSSTIVRDVATHGGDVSTLVPHNVAEEIKKKLASEAD